MNWLNNLKIKYDNQLALHFQNARRVTPNWILGFGIWILLLLPMSIFAQGIHTEFGKNRVQYQKIDWQQAESEHFTVYWTDGGRSLAEYAIQMGEQDFAELQNLLEYKMNDKIHLLVFNDYNDFMQSNAGSDQANYHNGGITRVSDNKIYVYFDGSHSDLHRQVREGITEVFLHQMMYGNSLQEIVQNAMLLNLPHWFTEGLKAYIGETWNTDLDNLLRDGIQSGKYKKFSDLVAENPRLAGHSMWYFIGRNYGKSTVSNLLYLTRINRSIEQGFLFVLGNSFRTVSKEWYDFYQQRYLQETAKYELPTGESIRLTHVPVRMCKIAPKGEHIAYVTQRDNRYKVILKDLKNDSEKVILKGNVNFDFGHIADENYPVLTWSKGNELAIIFEKRNNIKLAIYNVSEGKIKSTNDVGGDLERITHADFVSRRQLVVTASKNGQSDLFSVSTNGEQVRHITRDFYDERDVAFVQINGEKSLLFASNRDQAKVKATSRVIAEKAKTFDLYLMPLEAEKRNKIIRVTDTPQANERQPIQLDSLHFAWLGDANGMYNRYTGKLERVIDFYEKYITLSDGNNMTIAKDSTLVLPDSITIIDEQLKPVYKIAATSRANTNQFTGILQHSATKRGRKTADLVLNRGSYYVITNKINTNNNFNLTNTQYRDYKPVKATKPKPPQTVFDNVFVEVDKKETENTPESEPEIRVEEENPDYFFQSRFDEVIEPEEEEIAPEEDLISEDISLVESEGKPKKKGIHPRNVEDYKLKFKTDYLVVQFSNNLLFDGYTNYDHTSTYYQWTPFSALFEAGVKDLMEDHSFRGGLRLPFELNFPEFYLVYDNKKGRINKRFSFYRLPRIYGVANGNTLLFNIKNITNYFETRLTYPLDTYRSVRGFATVRSDQNIRLATDVNTLQVPTDQQNRVFARLEYVHDDTRNMGINLRTGTRYKVFAETAKRFDLGLRRRTQAQLYPGWMATLGLDARHYRKLTKNMIVATRVAGATSFGKEKHLYFMGGVDNWLVPGERNNREVSVPNDQQAFAFQTIATNMRGFQSNIRNGNSYMVWNTEIRARLFNNTARTSFRSSSFIRNLQGVLFADVGTAWQGLSPFKEDNPLNTVYVENPVVTVQVNYFRNPIVMGYGVGLRSIVFGHLVRLDYAWGVETGELQGGQIYLSLGMDF